MKIICDLVVNQTYSNEGAIGYNISYFQAKVSDNWYDGTFSFNELDYPIRPSEARTKLSFHCSSNDKVFSFFLSFESH